MLTTPGTHRWVRDGEAPLETCGGLMKELFHRLTKKAAGPFSVFLAFAERSCSIQEAPTRGCPGLDAQAAVCIRHSTR